MLSNSTQMAPRKAPAPAEQQLKPLVPSLPLREAKWEDDLLVPSVSEGNTRTLLVPSGRERFLEQRLKHETISNISSVWETLSLSP